MADGFTQAWVCSLWQISDDRVHRWRARRRDLGTLEDLAPGGNPVHGLLPGEIDAILAIAERWGTVDRSHRKLAHRGSYEGLVWVSPSSFRRVLAAHGLVLPEPPVGSRSCKRPWPDWLVWEPNRIWIWDVTHFGRARRAVFAIVDMVSRYWIDTLVSVEETATQVKVVFDHALESEGLLDLLTDDRLDLPADDPHRPILLAVSDNGPQMTADATRAYMALMAIAQHHGRPHTPTDQAWIETFFGHVKGEWPHLCDIDDPTVLETELTRVRRDYNEVRLHEAIGYVTPDDEHHGRGEQIREARRRGLARARDQTARLPSQPDHQQPPRGDPMTWIISKPVSAAKSDTAHGRRSLGSIGEDEAALREGVDPTVDRGDACCCRCLTAQELRELAKWVGHDMRIGGQQLGETPIWVDDDRFVRSRPVTPLPLLRRGQVDVSAVDAFAASGKPQQQQLELQIRARTLKQLQGGWSGFACAVPPEEGRSDLSLSAP